MDWTLLLWTSRWVWLGQARPGQSGRDTVSLGPWGLKLGFPTVSHSPPLLVLACTLPHEGRSLAGVSHCSVCLTLCRASAASWPHQEGCRARVWRTEGVGGGGWRGEAGWEGQEDLRTPPGVERS